MANLELDFSFNTKSLSHAIDKAILDAALSILKRYKDRVYFFNKPSEDDSDVGRMLSGEIVHEGEEGEPRIEIEVCV